MQLLAPRTGWLLAGNKLLWTEDNGLHWADVTPAMSLPNERVADVYFKDTNDGWVLVSASDDGPEAHFELASTVNSGASWEVTPVEVPGLNWRQIILYGAGGVYFLDSQRGWLQLDEQTGSAFRGALLLATGDGGKTWVVEPSSGTGGRFLFVDANNGWVAGGPTGGEFYVTRDGGGTWQEVEPKVPPEIGPALGGLYGVAQIFADANHGYLPVSYPSARALVLFATDDGGATWRPHRVFKGLPFIGAIPYPSAVADSAWLTAFFNQSTLTMLRTSLRGGPHAVKTSRATIKRERVAGGFLPVLEMTFSTAEQGWIRTDRLLSTEDGGATWSEFSLWGPHRK